MMTTSTHRGADLLRIIHAQVGLSRADAARALGIGTGAMTELVARLVQAELIAEGPAAPSGSRGRPTTLLLAHPNGPLVVAVAISHESWTIQVVELGGAAVATESAGHRERSGAEVIDDLRVAVRRLRRRFLSRVRGIAISAPGTVLSGRILDSANLGWRELDLGPIWPRAALFSADNDASLAALAEAYRGAASTARQSLHLRIDAGLGGAVVEVGRLLAGAHGVAGEFGHLPFADPDLECPCGARGCWGASVDGSALARLLRRRQPRDPVTFARAVLDRAAAGSPAELDAVRELSSRLGRGTAGLVNGLDPDVVTLGGLADPIRRIAPTDFDTAYQTGLMRFRLPFAPPVLGAALGEGGPLTGAAEVGWSNLIPTLRVRGRSAG